ncbi:unnamed protein product [Trichogramma brassicae]|uniref:Uncharacterized protein n=1 Tax=Trichogramma brassicae TaxID=86971 RepID=A0A6H5IXG9_9HYME|nr:unnamed protein product [Trichogramma brassicae]
MRERERAKGGKVAGVGTYKHEYLNKCFWRTATTASAEHSASCVQIRHYCSSISSSSSSWQKNRSCTKNSIRRGVRSRKSAFILVFSWMFLVSRTGPRREDEYTNSAGVCWDISSLFLACYMLHAVYKCTVARTPPSQGARRVPATTTTTTTTTATPCKLEPPVRMFSCSTSGVYWRAKQRYFPQKFVLIRSFDRDSCSLVISHKNNRHASRPCVIRFCMDLRGTAATMRPLQHPSRRCCCCCITSAVCVAERSDCVHFSFLARSSSSSSSGDGGTLYAETLYTGGHVPGDATAEAATGSLLLLCRARYIVPDQSTGCCSKEVAVEAAIGWKESQVCFVQGHAHSPSSYSHPRGRHRRCRSRIIGKRAARAFPPTTQVLSEQRVWRGRKSSRKAPRFGARTPAAHQFCNWRIFIVLSSADAADAATTTTTTTTLSRVHPKTPSRRHRRAAPRRTMSQHLRASYIMNERRAPSKTRTHTLESRAHRSIIRGEKIPFPAVSRCAWIVIIPNFSSTARWRSKSRPYATNIMHTANARLHRVQVAVHDREAAAANQLEDLALHLSRRRWHDGRVRELQQQQHSPRAVDIMQCSRALHHTLYVSIGLRTDCPASAAAASSHRVIESLRLKLTASTAMWLKRVTPAGPRRSPSSRAAAASYLSRIRESWSNSWMKIHPVRCSATAAAKPYSIARHKTKLRTIVSLTTRRTRGFACAAMSTTRREHGSERMNELQNFLITMHARVSSIVRARLIAMPIVHAVHIWASNASRRDELVVPGSSVWQRTCGARAICAICGWSCAPSTRCSIYNIPARIRLRVIYIFDLRATSARRAHIYRVARRLKIQAGNMRVRPREVLQGSIRAPLKTNRSRLEKRSQTRRRHAPEDWRRPAESNSPRPIPAQFDPNCPGCRSAPSAACLRFH